jgi:hypothetical protein
MSSNPSPNSVARVMVAVIALAAVLRSVGLAYGLPAVYNPDEVAIMNRALSLSQSGLNPHNFLYPTFYFYALFAWEGLWFAIGRLAGIYDSLAAFEASFFLDPTAIYLAGRTLTVACGVATVWAVYRLGGILFGPRAGVAAALLLAVAPLAVRDAHYVKHDVPVTLLIVLAYVVLAGDLVTDRPHRRRQSVLAGVLAGLAMSTHYYAVFLVLPVASIAIHPTAPGEPVAPRVRRLLTAGAACVVAFFAASPFLLVEPLTAMRDIVANREIVVDRATEATGAFGSLAFYGRWLAREAMGASGFALAAIGLVAAARSDWRRLGFLLIFPVLFLLFIANTFPASRYLNPILPFLAVLGGAAAAWLYRRGGPLVAGAVLAIVTAEAAMGSVRTDTFFQQTDTRTQALQWIEQHVPAEASILIQPYSVPLPVSRRALAEALTARLGSPDRASVRFRRQLEIEPYPAPAYRPIYLGDGGLDADKIYISPSSFEPEPDLAPLDWLSVTWVVMKRYNEPDPAMSALDAALEREARLAASFSPYAPAAGTSERQGVAPFLHNTDTRIRPELERPGPIIEIWTID